jgi:hypothetical protein
MELWGEGMAQLEDIEQIDRELEAFRARAQDTLKSFDRLEELISEFTKISQAYEAEVGNAAEITDLLKDRSNEIDQNWLQLKSKVDEVLELLNRSEIEREGRWVQYTKENKRAQEELRTSWQEFQAQLKQKVTDQQSDIKQRFAGVNRDLDLHATRLDDLQNAFAQRWTTLEEDLAKTKNGLIAADRNLRTHLEQMITDLRSDSEQRWTKLQEDGIKVETDFHAAHGDLRTASWRMVDDLREEAEGKFSEVNKSLACQAARIEEANDATDARFIEVKNRLAGELEASRQEYRKGLSAFEQKDAIMKLRIEKLQRMVWALLAIIIIIMMVIIYVTY